MRVQRTFEQAIEEKLLGLGDFVVLKSRSFVALKGKVPYFSGVVTRIVKSKNAWGGSSIFIECLTDQGLFWFQGEIWKILRSKPCKSERFSWNKIEEIDKSFSCLVVNYHGKPYLCELFMYLRVSEIRCQSRKLKISWSP